MLQGTLRLVAGNRLPHSYQTRSGSRIGIPDEATIKTKDEFVYELWYKYIQVAKNVYLAFPGASVLMHTHSPNSTLIASTNSRLSGLSQHHESIPKEGGNPSIVLHC